MSTALTSLSLDEQVALLMQGTSYGDETLARNMATELRDRLKEGRPLRVYCGFDPRTSDLHLGHTIPMRKLRQFQELGHEVTFLIGNYTSLLGDPSDKDRLRPMLTSEQVEANARTYAEQAFKILDRDRTRVRYNAEWLSKLSFLDVIQIAQNFTVQQFMTRENFALRLEKGEPIYLHETFYALMQAYDAVALETDVQVGGSDQLFNIITAGRKLQEAMGQRPQIGIILGILPGTDGVVKMSKSLGNHIPILAPPEDMYGKVMSIPDSALIPYFELATRYTPAMVEDVKRRLAGGVNPRDVKMELAREIVSIFHDPQAAERAEAHFVSVFQKKGLPDEMPEFAVSDGMNVVDVMVALKFAASKGEARRLIAGGGVYLDGRTVSDANELPAPPQILQVGKRRFARLVKA
ncbi:MAG: tyrosine--tRNA ligase [Anaerolineae bacterium]|nr:tyrosine--tRNA ligase [Candidatus Roseilinea sp.]MDW8449413.1 tyrosine--tRNA ligase [Anaerolineae bacterium]